MTYQAMRRKALINPELNKTIGKRLGANFKRIQRLAKLQKDTASRNGMDSVQRRNIMAAGDIFPTN